MLRSCYRHELHLIFLLDFRLKTPILLSIIKGNTKSSFEEKIHSLTRQIIDGKFRFQSFSQDTNSLLNTVFLKSKRIIGHKFYIITKAQIQAQGYNKNHHTQWKFRNQRSPA